MKNEIRNIFKHPTDSQTFTTKSCPNPLEKDKPKEWWARLPSVFFQRRTWKKPVTSLAFWNTNYEPPEWAQTYWPELQVVQLSCKQCGILQRNWVCAAVSHCRITNHPKLGSFKPQRSLLSPAESAYLGEIQLRLVCSSLHPRRLLEHPAPVCLHGSCCGLAPGDALKEGGQVPRGN